MKKICFYILFIAICNSAVAQDDLSALLDSTPQREFVSATFKTTRIINIQSNETVHKRTLDFRVAHRFGAIGKQSGGSMHNFYGIDASTDIRIAFEYGITDRLTAGAARHKHFENYEGLIKYRLIRQTNDDFIPVAVTLFGNAAYSARENELIEADHASAAKKNLRRLTYSAQVIIARKFSSRFSAEIIPVLIHRNFIVNSADDNNIFALGAAARLKVTRSMALIADYVYNFNSLRQPGNDNGFYNPFGAGMEFETGGHVFSVMFTNAEAILENEFIPETMSSWADGGFRFSFNISRNFRM
jgi:hypothetical protein